MNSFRNTAMAEFLNKTPRSSTAQLHPASVTSHFGCRHQANVAVYILLYIHVYNVIIFTVFTVNPFYCQEITIKSFEEYY